MKITNSLKTSNDLRFISADFGAKALDRLKKNIEKL